MSAVATAPVPYRVATGVESTVNFLLPIFDLIVWSEPIEAIGNFLTKGTNRKSAIGIGNVIRFLAET